MGVRGRAAGQRVDQKDGPSSFEQPPLDIGNRREEQQARVWGPEQSAQPRGSPRWAGEQAFDRPQSVPGACLVLVLSGVRSCTSPFEHLPVHRPGCWMTLALVSPPVNEGPALDDPRGHFCQTPAGPPAAPEL